MSPTKQTEKIHKWNNQQSSQSLSCPPEENEMDWKEMGNVTQLSPLHSVSVAQGEGQSRVRWVGWWGWLEADEKGWRYGRSHGWEFAPGTSIKHGGNGGGGISALTYRDRPQAHWSSWMCLWVTFTCVPNRVLGRTSLTPGPRHCQEHLARIGCKLSPVVFIRLTGRTCVGQRWQHTHYQQHTCWHAASKHLHIPRESMDLSNLQTGFVCCLLPSFLSIMRTLYSPTDLLRSECSN